MSARVHARTLALSAVLFGGCVLQAGAYGGHKAHFHGVKDHTSYGGVLQTRVAAGSKNLTFHLGTELDGHVEEELGSLVLSGAQAGVVLWPRHWVAFAPYASFGMPAGWNNAAGGSYIGGTFEFPFRLYARTEASEVNRNLRFLDSEGALVPFVRVRRYSLWVSGMHREPSYELVLGLAVRTEIVTDLVNLRNLF